MKNSTKWIKMLDDASELHENRVIMIAAYRIGICLSRFEGEICALDNKCPYQGGPPGKISKEQRSGHFEVWRTKLINPGFATFASSCGVLGLKADTPENLFERMKQLFAHNGPALLEIKTDVSLL